MAVSSLRQRASGEISGDAGSAPQAAGPQDAGSVRYVGVADWWGRHVWIEQAETRTGLRYSDGALLAFAWGRPGLGARELARSILQHASGETQLADALYGSYVHDVIVTLPEPGFVLERSDVIAWLVSQRP